MNEFISTSAILHVGRGAPKRPIGALCTTGGWAHVDMVDGDRFACLVSEMTCGPKRAVLGL